MGERARHRSPEKGRNQEAGQDAEEEGFGQGLA
jgi:hypothetical protein